MNVQRFAAVMLLITCSYAVAQQHRDPLTEDEVSKIREVTQEPDKRIKLYVQFAKARMMAIEQVRADDKLPGQGKQIHDLLEDFTTIADELDDNIDMYQRQHSDMRKSLKEVVEAYTEWQLKLRGIKESATSASGAALAEAKQYEFPLESAIDSVNTGLDSARDLLDKQNKDFIDAKKKKK